MKKYVYDETDICSILDFARRLEANTIYETNFENHTYAGQNQEIHMLVKIKKYLKKMELIQGTKVRLGTIWKPHILERKIIINPSLIFQKQSWN